MGSSSLIAAMHDRASVNNVAMSFVGAMFPSILDIGCFSHTLDNAGCKFITPTLSFLNTSFSDRQDSSLQDYIETSLMLQFNR